MIGRTNAKRGGSGNVTTVTLSSGASGEIITATRTGRSKTALTDSSGIATFKNLDMGYDWTFTWSTFSKTEKIDQLTESILLGQISIDIYWYQENPNGRLRIYEGQSATGTPVFDANTGSTLNQWIKIGSFSAIPNSAYYVTGFANSFYRRYCRKNSTDGENLGGSGGDSFTMTVTSDIESIWINTYDF